MRFILAATLALMTSAAFAEDTVAQSAASISDEDCQAYAAISDLIAEHRQDGKSERRTTRILKRANSGVDERYHAGLPTLVAYFYSLPAEAVVPGVASQAFLASCATAKGEDGEEGSSE